MSARSGRTEYRLYWINGSGSIDAVAEPIQAPDDTDAIRQAETLSEGDRVELWQWGRLVAQIGETTTSARPD